MGEISAFIFRNKISCTNRLCGVFFVLVEERIIFLVLFKRKNCLIGSDGEATKRIHLEGLSLCDCMGDWRPASNGRGRG